MQSMTTALFAGSGVLSISLLWICVIRYWSTDPTLAKLPLIDQGHKVPLPATTGSISGMGIKCAGIRQFECLQERRTCVDNDLES